MKPENNQNSVLESSTISKRHLSKQEADRWRKNLKNSDYKPYENFDNTVVNSKILQKYIDLSHHIKFYMGYNSELKNDSQFVLFMLSAVGEEKPLKYMNNYDAIYYYDSMQKIWISGDYEMLTTYSKNWQEYWKNKKMECLKAFLVPNADLRELDLVKVYLTFGLKEIKENEVKLILSNKQHSTNSESISSDDDTELDACMPCPKVCGANEF